MHKMALAAVAAAMSVGFAAPAMAAPTHFVGDYSVDVLYNGVPNSNNGLEMNYVDLPGDVDFTLDVGQSTQINLFKLFANEGSIQPDDLNSQPIQVGVAFTLPQAFGGSIGGETDGNGVPVYFFGKLLGYGLESASVQWNGPQDLHFGNGGLLRVSLNDVSSFNFGLVDLTPGSKHGAKIKATFEYVSAPTAVPEPAAWAMMITGFGFAGTMLRRRRAMVA